MYRILFLAFLSYSPRLSLANPVIGGSYSLTDNKGQAVNEKTYEGKYQLVFFGFTQCPSACPLGLSTISRVLDRLGAKSAMFQPVFISVDPDRDTQEVLTKYLSSFGKNFVGLRGPKEEVVTLIKKYRGYFQKLSDKDDVENYSFDHSTLIYFLDTQGLYLAHFESGEGAVKIANQILKKLPK